MIFYDSLIDIKNLVLSYNSGDIRLLKIKHSIIVKKYIRKYKPIYKFYTLNNIYYFETDNINIYHGISYIFSLSELDKLQKI